ncbi:hypothetical protein [Thiocystis violacea]|nr:hypothetical protein [Thiocystis violacea]
MSGMERGEFVCGTLTEARNERAVIFSEQQGGKHGIRKHRNRRLENSI